MYLNRLRMTLAFGLIVGVAGTAYGEQTDPSTTLQKARLLGIASEIGLDEGATVELVLAFSGYQREIHNLCAQRASLARRLAEPASRPGDPASLLNDLRVVDDRLHRMKQAAASAISEGLEAHQQARIYLFVMQLGASQPLHGTDGEVGRPLGPSVSPRAGDTLPNKPAILSDEAQVRAVIEQVRRGLETLDLDLLMSTFSEDFEHPEVGGKDEARHVFEMGIDMGYADNGKVFTDDMEIDIDGDGAVVYPIDLSSPAGAVTIELVLQKEEKGWFIKTIHVDGL